jgi:hypothetical protein
MKEKTLAAVATSTHKTAKAISGILNIPINFFYDAAINDYANRLGKSNEAIKQYLKSKGE